jgi:60 kDa SS-A/Ro ribonucleoprotein
MLWEDSFYVDGVTITEQIQKVCESVKPEKILQVALDAHQNGHLRHIPLFLIIQALKKQGKCAETIYEVCTRPDQMTELLSLYWKNGKKSIPAQLKKGLAKAFTRFDEYQLAKYNRDSPIKLRDILFLCHAKPLNKEQEDLWKRLVNKQLAIPDTWETRLSSGQDKKESFEQLLQSKKMGKLAVIRNLRNMQEAGVSKSLVKQCLAENTKPLLPFQFLAAAKMCPGWEDIVDQSMIQSMKDYEKLPGKTVVLVDVSGSMNSTISQKSIMLRMDAACGLAVLLREVCEDISIGTFSNLLVLVPNRNGMALRDAIVNSQPHQNTYLGNALNAIKYPGTDRVIVITDEQTADEIPKIPVSRCYIFNVGVYQNGIKNNGQWHTVTGFSEHCIDYIREYEKSEE